jgi:hypothetical protein
LQAAFFREIERHRQEMQSVSPHGHIGELRVPVFLLHGSSDNVIPASETMWLAKDVPPQELQGVLISPAMTVIHISKADPVTLSQKWALVDFMAQVLGAADKLAQSKK